MTADLQDLMKRAAASGVSPGERLAMDWLSDHPLVKIGDNEPVYDLAWRINAVLGAQDGMEG